MYSYSRFFNAFVFGGPKVKCFRILGDIDISKWEKLYGKNSETRRFELYWFILILSVLI